MNHRKSSKSRALVLWAGFFVFFLAISISSFETPNYARAAEGDPGSIQLDALTSYLSTSGDTQITPSGNWTIEGFVKLDATGQAKYVIRGYSGINGDVKEIEIYNGPAGYWAMKGYKDGVETNYSTLLSTYTRTDIWIRFVFSQDSDKACSAGHYTDASTTQIYAWRYGSGTWICSGTGNGSKTARLTSTNKITKWVIGSNESSAPLAAKFANVRISKIARYDLSSNLGYPTNYNSTDSDTTLLMGTSGDSDNYLDLSGNLTVTKTGTISTSTDNPTLGRATYTATFLGNSSDSGSMSPQSASVSTALTKNTFSRTGYNFGGWNTKLDGTGSAYSDEASYPFTRSSNLYAQWTADLHHVSYLLAGGTSAVPTQADVATGASFTTASTPTRSGYSFAGWNNGSSNTAAATSYTMGTSDLTLTAEWTRSYFEVRFNSQNGVAPVSVLVDPGQFPILPTSPSWYGYTFLGWSESVSGPLVEPTGIAIISAKEFYAVWEQKSIAGLTPAQLGTPDLITPHPIMDKTIVSTLDTASTVVKVPGGALPSNFLVKVYTLTDNTLANRVLGETNNYILSQVVAWSDRTDGTILDTVPGREIEMTISSPEIKVGAKVFSILGDSSTLLATASREGSVTVSFAIDPVIVVQAAPVAIVTQYPWSSWSSSVSVKGFKASSWNLTKYIRKTIRQFLWSVSHPAKISCSGYTRSPRLLGIEHKIALRRAIAVCSYVAERRPEVAEIISPYEKALIARKGKDRVKIRVTY